MFLQFPFEFSSKLQQLALIINTVLLIAALIVIELVYSEAPPEKRLHLRYFLPLLVVLAGLLLYAVYKQVGAS